MNYRRRPATAARYRQVDQAIKRIHRPISPIKGQLALMLYSFADKLTDTPYAFQIATIWLAAHEERFTA